MKDLFSCSNGDSGEKTTASMWDRLAGGAGSQKHDWKGADLIDGEG